MKFFKRLLLGLSTATIAFTMSVLPAFAYGDPQEAEEEKTAEVLPDVLPENPADEVSEDDHTPLTYDGTGTVVDNVLNGSKQFYTISTDEGNVFYLIVDLDKEYNNVYFLDTTKERDLIALAEKAEEQDSMFIKEEPVPQVAEPEEPKEPEVIEEPVKQSDNTAVMIILGIVLLGAAAVFFYYWVYKPRKDLEQAEEFEETFDFKNEDQGYDDALEELNSYED